MPNHKSLIVSAKAAIDRVNSDTSVPQEETKQSLEEIKEYIEELIDALEV